MRKFLAVNNRRNENPVNIKYFEDDIGKIDENNFTITIEKLFDIKKNNKSSFTINNTISVNSTNIEEEEIQENLNSTETKIIEDSNKIKVIAPPSGGYKSDDSETTDTIVTASQATADFSINDNEIPLKNETINDEDNDFKRKFFVDPQLLLDKIRKKNLYPSNITAKEDFLLLSCQSQPFLQRLAIVGEFF